MAISLVSASGSAGDGTASTSLDLTTTTNAVDYATKDFLIAFLAKDNTSASDGDNSEVTSVTGGNGDWTKLAEYTNSNGSAGAGVTISAWMFVATGSNPIGTVFTFNLSASTAHKVARTQIYRYTGLTVYRDPDATIQTSQVDAANDFGSSTLTGLSSRERLYLRALAKKANTTTNPTPSTGFTQVATVRSLNDASAVMVCGERRINTSTEETSSPTLAVSGNTAGVFLAIAERFGSSAPSVTGRPLIGGRLIR